MSKDLPIDPPLTTSNALHQSKPVKSSAQVATNSILTGRYLTAARIAWLFATVLATMLLVVSTKVALQVELFANILLLAAQVDVAMVQIVANNEFLTSTAFLLVAYGQIAAFFIVGLLLFWRKSNTLMGILTSIMLITVGVGFSPTILFLPIFQPAWHLPVSLLQAILFTSLIWFLYLFPNGRFVPGWTRYLALLWAVFATSWLFLPQLNPHRSATATGLFIFIGWTWTALVAQIYRYLKVSDTTERQQAKWVMAGFVATQLCFSLLVGSSLLGILARLQVGAPGLVQLIAILLGFSAILIPISIGFAILHARLWDIDIIINRTLVYGTLTVIVILIYILTVGALSALFQAQNNILISLIATGLIAVLFQPVHHWLQRVVNRLMFGRRDDPLSILTQLGDVLVKADSPAIILPTYVQIIAQSLKLPYVAVWTRGSENKFKPVAEYGTPLEYVEKMPLYYHNQPVGLLLMAPRAGENEISRTDKLLLEQIAMQTATAANTVRLSKDLQHSRERLVLTREEERRRIRRDLHDELGPSLASQTFKLDQALDLMAVDQQGVMDILQDLKIHNQELVGDIRRLVYELRPPALDELGLVAALQAHTIQYGNTGAMPEIVIEAEPDPLPPLPAAVEVAAYRIALEGITNVIRHARAKTCNVKFLIIDDKQLRVTLLDDGIGFDPDSRAGVGMASMRERAQELGGSFDLTDNHTTVTIFTAVLPLETV